MPTLTQCPKCRKLLRTKDELLGKKIKCPDCSAVYLAKAAETNSSKAVREATARPGIHISGGLLTLIILLVAVPTLVLIWYFGPHAARAAWEAQEATAGDHVKDVVEHVLKVKVSEMEIDLGSPLSMKNYGTEAIGVGFFFPMMGFSVPEKVAFIGTSKQGKFEGFFHPKTGEIEADIDFGGAAMDVVGVTKKGTSVIHATGREKNGVLTAEIDGKPAIIPEMPKLKTR